MVVYTEEREPRVPFLCFLLNSLFKGAAGHLVPAAFAQQFLQRFFSQYQHEFNNFNAVRHSFAPALIGLYPGQANPAGFLLPDDVDKVFAPAAGMLKLLPGLGHHHAVTGKEKIIFIVVLRLIVHDTPRSLSGIPPA